LASVWPLARFRLIPARSSADPLGKGGVPASDRRLEQVDRPIEPLIIPAILDQRTGVPRGCPVATEYPTGAGERRAKNDMGEIDRGLPGEGDPGSGAGGTPEVRRPNGMPGRSAGLAQPVTEGDTRGQQRSGWASKRRTTAPNGGSGMRRADRFDGFLTRLHDQLQRIQLPGRRLERKVNRFKEKHPFMRLKSFFIPVLIFIMILFLQL
jgi:hypothetical protein